MIPTVQLIAYNESKEPTGFERVGIRTNDTRARCNRCGEVLRAGQGVRSQQKIKAGWKNRGFVCLRCAILAIATCSEKYLRDQHHINNTYGNTNEWTVFAPTSVGSGKNIVAAITVARLLSKAVNP